MGRVLGREAVLKTVFYVIFGSVMLGLAVGGALAGNWLIVGIALLMAWTLWKASRQPKE